MRKSVKILGTGCPTCKTATAVVENVIRKYNVDATLEKVEDIMKIMEYDVLSTPALVVNEVVVFSGGIPSEREVVELLQ